MEKLLELAVQSGPFGVAVAAILIMGYLFHQGRVSDLKTQNDEHRTDKADYRNVITGNTEAITRMSGALENNTQTIRELQAYLRSPRQ